jgi:hypothetical protein
MDAMNSRLFRLSVMIEPRDHRLEILDSLKRSCRPYHVMDTIITVAATLIVAAANLLIATETVTQEVSELRILLIPFMGAIVASGGAILLNPKVETRNIVIGRAMIALLAGTAGPAALGVVFESTQWLWRSPAILLLAGAAISGLAYVLSRPFFSNLYNRSDAIAKREVTRLENLSRFTPPENDPPSQ